MPRTSAAGDAAIPGGRRQPPPVERAAPGVWSVPVPLPTGPAYVLVYLFETDAGPFLVDAGWDTEEAWDALRAGLAAAGTRVEDVRGVVVTHAHTDHYGLAGRVRAASGAWVALHERDVPLLAAAERDPAGRLAATLERVGAPPRLAARLTGRVRGRPAPADLPHPDRLLHDRDLLPLPGLDLRVLWTPGHSPGHICLWDEGRRLLLSGDHVLPEHAVGLHEPAPGRADPLGDYLRSLDQLAGLDPAEVLPAHEHRFTGLDARLGALRRHHRGRLAQVAGALRVGAVHAWDIAAAVTWHRPFEELRGSALRAALQDTLACLALLDARGLVRCEPGPPDRWYPRV
ncbi:MBL fold metallo-hydrolase [Streptomyces tremellae]|uniref:MBL fold metallo-hydrolase n=1 Tax=Streptomyces tremellae TaxID=1124239 RepID=A0ABP7G3N7_9ACTN